MASKKEPDQQSQFTKQEIALANNISSIKNESNQTVKNEKIKDYLEQRKDYFATKKWFDSEDPDIFDGRVYQDPDSKKDYGDW